MQENPDDPNMQPAAGVSQPSAGSAENGPKAEFSAEQGDTAELDRLRAENADLKDKILRSMAELENFRRRADREKTDTAKYAISDFARDLVTIGDNLRRAIDAIPRDAAETDANLKNLVEGVEVTERELVKVFERHGVTRFDPLGEKFDPHVHEAMIKVDVPNVPADNIVQVLHAGYKIGDRVLRPAAVIVARGSSETKNPGPASRIYSNVVPPAASDGDQMTKPTPETANFNPEKEGRDAPDTEGRGDVKPFRQTESDPDVPRSRSGAPRGRSGQGQQEKRTSNMTKPVTENSGPAHKDEFVSTFGKRLES